ncbi:MAG: ThiF family adenylyltransferase [Thermoanaerobaculaceae bacterium]|nr:ThiF family adenylyltransferase [Thermoanaerobaculaceae bacterium]MDI9621888.1 ThiF family adenylyltransferase [Acidobacteriota bacterium]NLH12313.1 thiazole biosynthesis adenylyltransferase ThiF [Holophagae bacterium]HPW55358.1 ThiF family adenylyltransferase [Thermoanaerobaculaceae bacterium]
MLDGRYSRQALFAPIGVDGQARIAAARVLMVGCGGLGTVSASLLARAGAGFLRIVDRDVVELSNLQRQALFSEADVRLARPKAVAAAERLADVNHEVAVEPIVADITPANIRALTADVDLVVDGFDSFEGRYLLNDACVERGLPWVYGACVAASGMAMLVVPGQTPCLRCLYPQRPEPGAAPTCDAVGVLGSATHLTAALQVGMALRWLVTREAPRPAVMMVADVWNGRCDRVELAYDPAANHCLCCVKRRFEFLDTALPPAAVLCGRNAVMLRSEGRERPDLQAIAARIRRHGEVVHGEHLVRLRTGEHELTLFADGRIVVKGTGDIATARAAAARLLGV